MHNPQYDTVLTHGHSAAYSDVLTAHTNALVRSFGAPPHRPTRLAFAPTPAPDGLAGLSPTKRSMLSFYPSSRAVWERIDWQEGVRPLEG